MKDVLIALITIVPPTIAAIAALIQVRRLTKPLNEVNAAVNHRKPGERRLVEMVDDIHAEVREIRDDVRRVQDDLGQHRAWHQITEGENP